MRKFRGIVSFWLPLVLGGLIVKLFTDYSIFEDKNPRAPEITTLLSGEAWATDTHTVNKVCSFQKLAFQNFETDARGRSFSGMVTHGYVIEAYLKAPTVEMREIEPEHVQIVVACNTKQFNKFMINSERLFNLMPKKTRILFYDLDLFHHQSKNLRMDSRFIYRKFHFELYPPAMKILENRMFVAIALQSCLMEFGACMWLEPEVYINGNVIEIMKLKRKNDFYFLASSNADEGRLFSRAVHPDMFGYFPSNVTKFDIEKLRTVKSEGLVVHNTNLVQTKIMRYAIACSLTKDCIAPAYKNYPRIHHQYDASLMNLLAYQAFQNISRYTLPAEYQNFLSRRSLKQPTADAGGQMIRISD